LVFQRVISDRPPNTGVLPTALSGDSLDQQEMFVRCSFGPPFPLPTGFDVIVPGKRPRQITPDMLGPLPPVEVDVVLECAGNGRALMRPTPEGIPWLLDGVSPITVGGVRLADVLGSLPEDIVDVVFTGADRGFVHPEGEVHYQYSLSADEARSRGPILATHIGGEPLTAVHGAPIRLIVPGQYGMKSVKWLTRVEAMTSRFTGHFVRRYRYLGDAVEPDGAQVGHIEVRSMISSPFNGETVSAPVEVRGSAWSGSGEVEAVEVSVDDGATWHQANLIRRETGGRWAPVRWAVTIDRPAGRAIVLARAFDAAGASQPLDPRWNEKGYGNNVVHRVSVDVV